MKFLEQFESNVHADFIILGKYGTEYRKITSYFAVQLLRHLLEVKSNKLIEFTQQDFVVSAKAFLNMDDERSDDVGKFLYIHKQELLTQLRNSELYQRADDLSIKALGFNKKTE